MKHLKASFLAAAALALLGASAALADDSQLTNRLLIQRAASSASDRSTTVAVYTGGDAGATRAAQDSPSTTCYEWRPNGHGQSIGLYRDVH